MLEKLLFLAAGALLANDRYRIKTTEFIENGIKKALEVKNETPKSE